MAKTERILVPMDFSDFSLSALSEAVDQARAHDAELHLLHVEEPIFPVAELAWFSDYESVNEENFKMAQRAMDQVLASKVPAGLMVTSHVAQGSITDTIADYAREHNIDLIVMATHGRRGLSHVLMGSVTEDLMKNAPCPMLIIRPIANKATNSTVNQGSES